MEQVATLRLSKGDRAKLHAKFQGRCAYCGMPLGERWHADHVEPVIRQTRYERGRGYVKTGNVLRPHLERVDNIMAACAPCNISKGSHSLEGWRQELARTLDILRRNYPTYRTAFRFGMIAEVVSPVIFWFEMDEADARRSPLTPGAGT